MEINQHTKNSTYTLPPYLIKRCCEGGFIVIFTLALFILFSLITYHAADPSWSQHYNAPHPVLNAGGIVGAYIADGCYAIFGYCAYVLPLCIAYLAAIVLMDYRAKCSLHASILWFRGIGLLCLIISSCGLLTVRYVAIKAWVHPPGGELGLRTVTGLSHFFNLQSTLLFLIAMLLVGMTWLTGLSWVYVTERLGYCAITTSQHVIKYLCLFAAKMQASYLKWQTARRDAVHIAVVTKPAIPPITLKPKKIKETPKLLPIVNTLDTTIPDIDTNFTIPIKSPSSIETLPELSLLDVGKPGPAMGGYLHQELEQLSRNVEQHLLDFGLQVNVVAVHPGPVITRFELQLAPGIKVNRLTSLAKDLARSLSVISVRVVEIIPGKTVVGIELPNPNRAMVCLSDVLSADVYQNANSTLTLALGVDIAGHPMVVDLAKMPHLLVAGTTGSGKSVGINAMILSLLFKATPEQVRLILIDPKMLELSVYDGIPHLLTPVVTDMVDAASALRWCVAEMERRYRLMAAMGVRNIIGFNHKILSAIETGTPLIDPLWRASESIDSTPPTLSTLPYIVVVIDELADMMMVVGKKVEQLIARIAQKARAAGIHLILATQRPSVDVLTGLIKSNIPTRISFQVSSKIDSRTILDQQGAEQLLGHGDMLFLAPGTGAPLRVHGAFVSDLEVHKVADAWRARGEPQYIDTITQFTTDLTENSGADTNGNVENVDALYDQAVAFVVQTRKASISAVQRRFKIGYNRAARLVEEMERTGIVGPLEGGFRDVLTNADIPLED